MKIKTTILTGLTGLLILTGCDNTPQPQSIAITKCVIDGAKAPKWVCNSIDTNKTVYAVGSAFISPLGFNFQKTEAISKARDEISRKGTVLIENMIKKYYESTGGKNNQANQRDIVNVSKQLSKSALNNSKMITLWLSPKKTMFVLVGIDRKNIQKAVTKKNIAKISAKLAQKNLNKEIDKNFQ